MKPEGIFLYNNCMAKACNLKYWTFNRMIKARNVLKDLFIKRKNQLVQEPYGKQEETDYCLYNTQFRGFIFK